MNALCLRLTALLLVLVGLVAGPSGALAQSSLPPALSPSTPERIEPVPTSRPAPSVGTAAGILLDMRDGTVLWERNARERRAIASTTKILTALVVLEEADMGATVVASARAQAVGSDDPLVTQINLTEGERLSVEDLVYALLLPSGNDAALALAEHVGGSVEAFAEMMNERARQAGALDSNFTNANGLDDPAAYSTAYDLARISLAAMSNDDFRRVVATPRHRILRAGRAPTELVNRNELLAGLDGAHGVKTGNTRMAGRTLVASAEREGEERLSVVLGSPDPFRESAALLNFGFAGFFRFSVVDENRVWGQVTYGDGTSVRLVAGEDVSVLLGESSGPPRVRFRPAQSELLVDVRGGLVIPVEAYCLEADEPCAPPRGGRNLLASLISVFSPVLVALR